MNFYNGWFYWYASHLNLVFVVKRMWKVRKLLFAKKLCSPTNKKIEIVIKYTWSVLMNCYQITFTTY